MVSVSDITSKNWSPKLGAFGEIVTEIEDIAQCIRIICGTRLGEVPLEPEFGSEIYRWLDAPLDVARVNIPIAIYASVGRWEPRVVINSVHVGLANNLAGIVIAVNWAVVQNPAQSQTLVLTTEQRGITEGGQRVITAAMAESNTLIDMRITDYRSEFLGALNS